jgi:hypothetical protein
MADSDYDFACAVEAANSAVPGAPAKATLLDLSAMDWGPCCSIVKLPIGPNGAPRFLAIDTTQGEKGAE